MNMKNICLLCAVLVCKMASAEIVAPDDEMHRGRVLVWNDEFNGSELDTLKWEFRVTMGSKDRIYADDSRTYRFEKGCLRLMAKPTGDVAKPYILPHGLATHNTMNYRYGYLEMRARVPFVPGAWPSFWLQSPERGRSVDWMAEIDVFEVFSNTNQLECAIHKWGNRKHASCPGSLMDGGRYYTFENRPNLNEEFHVYGYEWTEHEMKFYVDGKCHCTIKLDDAHDFTTKDGGLVGTGGFRDPKAIIVNNELFTPGSTWKVNDGILTADCGIQVDYWIDYIRLWQRPNSKERITYNLAKGGE